MTAAGREQIEVGLQMKVSADVIELCGVDLEVIVMDGARQTIGRGVGYAGDVCRGEDDTMFKAQLKRLLDNGRNGA